MDIRCIHRVISAQIFQNQVDMPVTVVRVLFRAPQNDVFQPLGDLPVFVDIGQFFGYLFKRDRDRCLAAERHPSGEQFEEDDAEGINVRALVRIPALCLFRRNILHGAHDLVRFSHPCFAECLGNAEIGDPHPFLLIQQDVLGLDVPVDDAPVMGMLNASQYLDGKTHRFLYGNRMVLINILLQSRTVHHFGDEQLILIRLVHIEDIDDVRMGELDRALNFPLEPEP